MTRYQRTLYQLHILYYDCTDPNNEEVVTEPHPLAGCHSLIRLSEGDPAYLCSWLTVYHPEPAATMEQVMKVWTWFMIPLGVLFVCRLLWIAAHWNR